MVQRNITHRIIKWIDRPETIFLLGPRQVGKTTLLKYLQQMVETSRGCKTFYFNLEDPDNLELAENYSLFVKTVSAQQKVHVFLDEIQLHSRPSNFIKYLYDEHREHIKLYVTGSANLEIKAKFQDSLAGRKIDFHVMPFDFHEFLDAKGYKPEDNPIKRQESYVNFIREYLMFGGMPAVVLADEIEIKKSLLREYISTYINRDIRSLIREDNVIKFNQLNVHLAQIVGGLKNDARLSSGIGVTHTTLGRYLDILENTFIYSFLQPYIASPIARIKKAKKVYIFDLGIRNSLLDNFIDPDKRSDAERGALFENFIFMHLSKSFDREIYYLRTSVGAEIDFVCKKESSTYQFEVKYSSMAVPKLNKGARNLLLHFPDPKPYVINLTYDGKHDGIQYVSVMNFLESKFSI